MLWYCNLKIGSKRLRFVYHVQLAVKILKSRRFWNISSKTQCRSGFDLSNINCIWCISLVSFWHHLNLYTIFHTRYANLGLFWPKFCNNDVRTRIKISKVVKPVLWSQDINSLYTSSYFDPFITICTWCTNYDFSLPNLRLMSSQRGSKKLTWKMNCSTQTFYCYWF